MQFFKTNASGVINSVWSGDESALPGGNWISGSGVSKVKLNRAWDGEKTHGPPWMGDIEVATSGVRIDLKEDYTGPVTMHIDDQVVEVDAVNGIADVELSSPDGIMGVIVKVAGCGRIIYNG